jgi:stage III sporulation protein AE
MLTVGTLDMLVDMGRQTIEDISIFSKALLPTLAAVTAASGAIGTASVHQVATAFFVDMLLQLIRGILLPMVYLYIGVMVAGTVLSDGRLNGVAAALKKVVVWVLSTSLLIFTLYLSVTKVISGTTDGATLKVTKAAISGVVPVVGSILSDAAETVLAGAGILKGTVGVFGMLAVLAICIRPFLQLGIQYLLYKLAAFLAAMAAPSALCKLIDGLGTTFGLVLGMTGACGVLLLVSIVSFVTAVTP